MTVVFRLLLHEIAEMGLPGYVPSCTVPKQPLLPILTSQILHVPSVLTDASSASLTGFQATRSMAPPCPRSSVVFLTVGLSGFQILRVRSVLPVAIRWPVGEKAIVRILSGIRQQSLEGLRSLTYENPAMRSHSMSVF